jgi:hypothetical protein
MAKDSDSREAWVQAQADALYADLKAREAAEEARAAESTTIVEGNHYGVTGGVHHGGRTWTF